LIDDKHKPVEDLKATIKTIKSELKNLQNQYKFLESKNLNDTKSMKQMTNEIKSTNAIIQQLNAEKTKNEQLLNELNIINSKIHNK